MLEGPVPAPPVSVVCSLGHLSSSHSQGRLGLGRSGHRGEDRPGDHHQVQGPPARPHRVRLYEDDRPVQAGDGLPGLPSQCGAPAGPGPVHPGRLREEQVHQSTHQVRRLAVATTINYIFLLRFGRLLLVIPLLRMVRANLVESLFFRETVGETNIKNIILDLYKCDKLPSL